jgi:hypothetical protein
VPIIKQAMNIGGLVLGLVILGLIIWSGLARLSRAITAEIHTASLATLRLQHEAERLARREKVVFRADSDVLALLEQAILDASGKSVHVRLLPNGWVSSPPLMAVIDAVQTRYLFSPLPPEQVRASARRHGLTQLLLGQATDLTAYPIDALNSTPFIVDDLSAAFGYVLSRHQAPRRPLPRTDRWYLYAARPRTSRLPLWFDRSAIRIITQEQETEPMPYSDQEQLLRVASAISAIATGCCLRYGLFASIFRQPVIDVNAEDDAFLYYYDLLHTINLSTTEDTIHPTRTWLICRIGVPEPVERYFLQAFTAGRSNGWRWSVWRGSCCRPIRCCFPCRRSWT